MEIPHALAVTSGTAALRVALAALNIKENDEVITQSFTFVATVEAIIESRAIPVITEIDKTLNMDPVDLKEKITDKTKAIIVVHMLGVPARLKELKKSLMKVVSLLSKILHGAVVVIIRTLNLGRMVTLVHIALTLQKL